MEGPEGHKMSCEGNLEANKMGEPDPQSVENNVTHKRRQKESVHHAHFVVPPQQDVLEAHDSIILVEPLGEDTLNVRLGFLQVMHVYDVQFSIEDDLGEDVTFDPLENVHAKIESIRPSVDGKGHDIVLTFRALKEKIMQEAVTITSISSPSRSLVLQLHARVLGKGKGTPLLKKGIHCVRIEWEEEADGTDWQG
ncbi:unnamed protein product [Candidula unifasciata]|uniref:Adipose-secreted signaling protein n=1 Tax=Candidula unifasciata TaxID=100452 RepID=A0A8S3YJP9_9EUPU|nr:unnamed protein product [Candidula unifasciata]